MELTLVFSEPSIDKIRNYIQILKGLEEKEIVIREKMIKEQIVRSFKSPRGGAILAIVIGGIMSGISVNIWAYIFSISLREVAIHGLSFWGAISVLLYYALTKE